MGRELRMLDTDPVAGPQPAEVERACAGGAALVVLSAVNYRSGSFARMAEITAAGHAAGALVLWDLCHAAGAVEVDLDAVGADLAVGCTYKYLNAGPGSPALLYVRSGLQAELRSPIWGWFSQADQFAMGPDTSPSRGSAGSSQARRPSWRSPPSTPVRRCSATPASRASAPRPPP